MIKVHVLFDLQGERGPEEHQVRLPGPQGGYTQVEDILPRLPHFRGALHGKQIVFFFLPVVTGTAPKSIKI